MIPKRYAYWLLLSMFMAASPISAVVSLAAEPDLSCVDQELRERIQVSQQYREYDIVIRNSCPGAVYWAMCIQPVNPWTHAVTGELTPSGQLAPADTARVNLMMQKQRAPDSTESTYESFYLNLGYAVSSVPRVECVARECEQAKAGWRAERAAHENAWRKTSEQLDQEVTRQCMSGAWKEKADEDCERTVRADHRPYLDSLQSKIAQLDEKLLKSGPDYCKTLP